MKKENNQKQPIAHICINKSRVKIYDKETDPKIYLSKQTEFQIELFNPTTDVVLAKITLNGNSISQGGLVLNPGQRVFLERYLDVAKKFLFDTYEVSNTNEVKKAIENNGDFKVEFFRERKVYNNPFLITTNATNGLNIRTIYGGPNEINQGILRGSSTGGYVGQTTTNINNTFSTNSTNTLGLTGGITNTSLSTGTNAFFNQTATNTGGITLDSLYDANVTYSQKTVPLKKQLKSRSSKSLLVETGRVEKGSSSDQKIKTIDKDFEFYSFHTIECKMLPISQKINTTEDINVKVYCTNCGTKLGKGHKFCSTCGTKA